MPYLNGSEVVPAMSKKKLLTLAFTCAGLAALTLIALLVYRAYRDRQPLPVLGKAPSFNMTDAETRYFSTNSLAGKVYVVNFFFTNCPGPCPTMSKNMARIRDAAPAPDLHLLNISVDPTNDQPAKLKAYSQKFGADPATWHFLTAPEDKVRKVSVKGFKMGDDQIINHSTRFCLVDREGMIRGYYDGTDSGDVKRLIRDIGRLP